MIALVRKTVEEVAGENVALEEEEVEEEYQLEEVEEIEEVEY